MSKSLSIALAQINPIVGDINGNAELIRQAYRDAVGQGADLVVCPELVISGYPAEDLVLKPAYQAACQRAVASLADITEGGPGLIIGTPWPDGAPGHVRARPFNACILLADGAIAAVRYKNALPNYSVFDEPRTFQSGPLPVPVMFRDVSLGLMTCEDMWYPDVSGELKEQGAEILIAPHGSPYRETAWGNRLAAAESRMMETGLPLIFVNQVGGQDELVFDGCSFAANPPGPRFSAPAFEEGVYLTRWQQQGRGWVCTDGPAASWPMDAEQVYRAVTLGTRDYVRKNGFSSVVLGLSGGVDSALTAAIAVDALGADNVHCVMMPSRYTADDSLADAEACAKALGVRYDIVPIARGIAAFDEMLGPLFEGRAPDVTEENLQSRLRGTLLMALSNKFGSMLLTTGNKSEMAVGYATLYGDMNGGYNPLKDLYKLQVFDLCRWRNGAVPRRGQGPGGEVIPRNIITKPPSAELREDQRDDDSLPPYEVLDSILQGLVENDLSVTEIVAGGHDAATVARVEHLLYLAEYKRRQSPPGPKVTTRNFGRDRRYPITSRWRDPADG